MSKKQKYVPRHSAKHRAPKSSKVARNTVILSTVAVAATGATVASGFFGDGGVTTVSLNTTQQAAAGPAPTAQLDAAAVQARMNDQQVSRSDRRTSMDATKQASLNVDAGDAVTVVDDLSDDDPKDIARALMAAYDWGDDQFNCLDLLWTRESNWRTTADNPTSSAYGIPQALPGEKMASAGADWATNPATQIKWGLGYIADRYGTPCSAWGHSEAVNWY